MASSEHLDASNFIKSIHQKLRDEAKVLGAQQSWKKHCEDEENLKKYASAMHNLASNHWENNYQNNTKAASRVEWIYQFTQTYFNKGEMRRQREREIVIANKINLEVNMISVNCGQKYKVLDVGSCYNPFQKYERFDVLPIDIAPATSDVYKCDFLNLKVSTNFCQVTEPEISELQRETFDVIVFSLLLEYMPSPSQRLLSCEKAYALLKVEGILFIITPDSKHVGANAKIMKSWRFILAKLGFSRIKYEKLPYLHCMVFRKCLKPEIAQRWAMLQQINNFYDEFVIPQDFKQTEKPSNDTKDGNHCQADLFEELPTLFDFE